MVPENVPDTKALSLIPEKAEFKYDVGTTEWLYNPIGELFYRPYMYRGQKAVGVPTPMGCVLVISV